MFIYFGYFLDYLRLCLIRAKKAKNILSTNAFAKNTKHFSFNNVFIRSIFNKNNDICIKLFNIGK